MFYCEYCEIFKNIYFQEHLRTAAFRMIGEKFCFILKRIKLHTDKKHQEMSYLLQARPSVSINNC